MNASPNKGGRPRKVIKPFPPLEHVTSPTVDTDAAARKPCAAGTIWASGRCNPPPSSSAA